MIHGVVSVIIPTAGRKTVYAASKSLEATTMDYPIEKICVVNGNLEALGILNRDQGRTWMQMRNRWNASNRGAIASWNEGLLYSQGEFVVMGADDLVFQEGWLTEALKCLREQTGGVGCVGFNDLHNGAAHQTHFLMHRSFIINHLGGVLVSPIYHHFYCDNELVGRAKAAGLYAYAEKSLVRHDHWANNRRPFDKWDESVKAYFREDEALYLKRQAAGFPNDFDPVIAA